MIFLLLSLALALPANESYFTVLEQDGTGNWYARHEVDTGQTASMLCYRLIYDPSSRLSSATYICGGRPIISPELGNAASLSISYLPDKRIVRFFAANGDPANGPEGTPIIVQMLDENGFVHTEEYRARDNTAVYNSKGIYRKEFVCDGTGRRVRERRFDAEGKPASDRAGVSELRYEYVSGNYPSRELRLGADGQSPAYGAPEVLYTRDGLGDLTTISYADGKGNLYAPGAGLATIVEYARNDWGFLTSRQYRDRNNNALSVGGYATLALQRNADNLVVLEQYLDVKGRPVSPPGSPARIITSYDGFGNAVEISGRDSLNRPAPLHASGIASIRRSFGNLRESVGISYYDANGKLMRSPQRGVAGICNRLDEHDRVVEQWYLDENSKPMPRKDLGVFRIQNIYNNSGDLVEQRYVDEQGRLMPAGPGKPALRRWSRDGQGRTLTEEILDVHQQPAMDPETGAAVMEYSYSKDGYTLVFLDAAGLPTVAKGLGVYRIITSTDRFGAMTRQTYANADGKPMPASGGVWELRFNYDREGVLRLTQALDETGKVILEKQPVGTDSIPGE